MKRCTNILDVVPIIIENYNGKSIMQMEIEKTIMLHTGWRKEVCVYWLKQLEYLGYIKQDEKNGLPGKLRFYVCKGKPGVFKRKYQKKLEAINNEDE